MENKLNQQSIQSYARDYASTFCPRVFTGASKLSGKEIIGLDQHPQINFLVIAHLFDEWQKERKKLHSHYFDFSAKEVQNGLDEFMNLLSRHIAVEAKHFKPLLEKAVADTINIIFDPYEWLIEKIQELKSDDLRKADLEKIRKYQKLNTLLIDKMMDRMGTMVWSKKESLHNIEILWDELEGELEDTLPHVKQLSKVLAPNLDILYTESGLDNTPMPTYSFSAPARKPDADITPTSNESKTVNEVMAKDKKTTLADHLQKSKKVETLQKSLSVHQKFLFTNQLFANNREQFNKAIDKLDQCSDYEQAEEMISASFVDEFQWDMESEVVAEFLEMLAQRFGHLR